MTKGLISSILFLSSAAATGLAIESALPRPVVVETQSTQGSEQPQEGALYQNGWVVANVGHATFMDADLRYGEFLGEPISSFDGHCQTFRLGRLCYQQSNPPDWQVELDNLGLQDLQVEGRTPHPGSAPHPALRDWITSEMEAGVDTTRVVGRILGDPVCDKDGQCRQWTDKQLFLLKQNAVTGDGVERAPLGLWLTHPQTRPTTVYIQHPVDYRLVVAAAAAALLGLLILTIRPSAMGGASAV